MTMIATNPEFAPQVQGLDRQRKLAEMLITQGFQPPQGQMVSGRYVAPSWTQQLASLANIWAGKGIQEEADAKQMEMLSKYKQLGQQELADFLRAKEGVTEQRTPVAGPPTDEMIARKQFTPEQVQLVKGEPMDKMALALKASNAQYNPMLPVLGAELLKQQFKEPEWVASTRYDDKGREIHGWINKNSNEPEATFRGGTVKPDLTAKDLLNYNIENQKFQWETGNSLDFGPYKVSSPVGQRKDPITGSSQYHAGTDVKIPSNVALSPTTIPELAKDIGGKVIRTVPEAQSGGYGNMVEVQRPDGSIARYAHLSNINVKQGDTVSANTVYGNPGNTGKSTGVHLHYEVKPAQGVQLAQVGGNIPQSAMPPAFRTKAEQQAWYRQQEEQNKPPTESQGQAAGFGIRAKEANQLLKDLEAQGVTNTGKIRSAVGQIVGATPFIGQNFREMAESGLNFTASDAQQQTDQARRNFVTAILRKESGASISPTEFANEERKYFPVVGDSPTVIAQKQRAREIAIQSLEAQAGPVGSRQIQQFQPSRAFSAEDNEALNWANKNPNDPRATAIKQKLGVR